MDDRFQDDEKLYRAVLPTGMYWKEDGSLSSAAFDDKAGLSVDRGYYRTDEEASAFMRKSGKRGSIFRFLVRDCREKEIVVKYIPLPDNEFHSEVHGSEEKPKLTRSQCRHLARVAVEVKEAV